MFNQKKIKKNKGFTLVEFIVVLTIFSIMTAVSMFSYNDHRSSLMQSVTVEDIALTIRQAQVYGISATDKKFGGVDNENELINDTDPFDVIDNKSIRGLFIDLAEKKISLYEDVNKNLVYNSSVDILIDEKIITSPRIKFSKIKFSDSDSDSKNNGYLDIAFRRPYPDALISYRSDAGSVNSSRYHDKVTIFISDASDEGVNSCVQVNSIGRISVRRDCK